MDEIGLTHLVDETADERRDVTLFTLRAQAVEESHVSIRCEDEGDSAAADLSMASCTVRAMSKTVWMRIGSFVG